jgi:hypothetical protein
MDETQDYIERLFVHDVDRIPELERTGYQYDRVLLSSILRRLVIDGAGLAHLANRPYKFPLLVLIPEPESGNVPRDQFPEVPESAMKYAPDISERSYPPGFYHRPYRLNDFLKRPMGVVFQPITAKDAIELVAHKLGGVHISPKFESEALYEINKRVSFFGKGSVYALFDQVAGHLWRCLAPLRDIIVEKHGGSCAFPVDGA